MITGLGFRKISPPPFPIASKPRHLFLVGFGFGFEWLSFPRLHIAPEFTSHEPSLLLALLQKCFQTSAMTALAGNLTGFSMGSCIKPLLQTNANSSFASSCSVESIAMYHAKKLRCSVLQSAATRSRQLLHSLKTDESLETGIRKSWSRLLSTRWGCLATGRSMAFPRTRERDPYKLLGIHREAGEEEVREVRIYLAEGVESSEAAYDKIMMEKLREYQKSQFKPKKEIKPLPAWQQKIVDMYQIPNKEVILRIAAFYVLVGV
ncbi:uncharacterized protein [Physcomitrium patens]|uniref:uncharacterized protein isoform X3 n=1 Tax=Physcomitrium patens TaxID=3218 RepID=UPI000D16E155|nr:uncharacterized protein LOC112287814 isoform X3 [Physcomitrium patens]|eukprot:XP_024387035.1 uncharacterized protein LOC112287814 isoform X3 [Physcomitrella patens]